MHGLLADAILEFHGCKVSLVQDNALLASQKDQAHHRPRHQTALDIRSKSAKKVLDISDHKESRWVSIRIQTEGMAAQKFPPRVNGDKGRKEDVWWTDDNEKRKS
jgi:hypothetical protein